MKRTKELGPIAQGVMALGIVGAAAGAWLLGREVIDNGAERQNKVLACARTLDQVAVVIDVDASSAACDGYKNNGLFMAGKESILQPSQSAFMMLETLSPSEVATADFAERAGSVGFALLGGSIAVVGCGLVVGRDGL